MSKEKFTGLVNGFKKVIIKRSPEILTGIGIAGMISAGVLAVRATPKALELIHERKEELYPLDEDKKLSLTPLETVKICWKCYIPAVSTCILSAACIIGASSVHTKRNAAIAAAYKLSEKALIEYKDAVIETIGEKKELEVRDKMAEKHIEKDPVSKTEVIITDKGTSLCYDSISGRYFKSDIETIKRAENVINKQLLSDMYVSLNDFYDEIGLDYTKVGRELGWSVDEGLIEIHFSSQLADDGTPCLVVEYYTPPRYNFDRFD